MQRRVSLIISLLIPALPSCATVPPADTGGITLVDLAKSEAALVGAAWAWQPARFDESGRVPPPNDEAFVPLAPTELSVPRGGQNASAVWYQLRFTVPRHIDGKALALAVSADDYGEIVVDGVLRADVGGYNAELAALVTPSARAGQEHTVWILGVNGPLGRPPFRPLVSNEVFLRAPVRLVVDAALPSPPPAVVETGAHLRPYATCPVALRASPAGPLVVPDVDALPACSDEPAPVPPGPRWWRFDADGAVELHVYSDGYAEVWVDGACDLAWGQGGRGAMSPRATLQRVRVTSGGKHRVDVLTWPAPFTKLAGSPETTRAPGVVAVPLP